MNWTQVLGVVDSDFYDANQSISARDGLGDTAYLPLTARYVRVRDQDAISRLEISLLRPPFSPSDERRQIGFHPSIPEDVC